MIVYIISQKPGKYKTNFIKPSQRKTDILYREFAAKSHFILEMLAEQEPNALRLLDRLEELRMLIAAKAYVNSDVPFVLSTIHSSKGLEYDRVVLVTDIRGGTRFDSLFQALDGLRAMQCAYSILFMEATDEQ